MPKKTTVEDLVEIKLHEPDDFLKIKETLTRIGIASNSKKRLVQSCHILHVRGRYFITHFKERYALDGFETTLTEEDIARRNTIAGMIASWGLCELMDPSRIEKPQARPGSVRVIKHSEKDNWELAAKYNRWPT